MIHPRRQGGVPSTQDRGSRVTSDTSVGTVDVHPRVPLVGPPRVLLVEDDEGDAFLVQELLIDSAPDINLERVKTLGEAEAVLPGDFQCVLLDLGLPDAQGLDGLRLVLEAAPNLAVLVLTGLSDEFRGIESLSSGAQDYLVKGSIDGELLHRAIRYAVERKRADESMRQLYASEARAAENARLERGLLPQPLISDTGVQVVARYTPGRHQALLGGDFYDVVERDDGALFLLIGDVAGHGPDEAALGVCLRIAWRTLVLAGVDAETILPSMAAVLISERSSDEVFATVTMVRVDPERAVARCWLAGHPWPLVIDGERSSSRRPGQTTGIALGIDSTRTWVATDIPVERSDQLLLFTDGLVEGYAGPDRSARLGDEGMRELLEKQLAAGASGDALIEGLMHDVRTRNGGELTDDVAILLVSWAGA
jgi:serine phosphatase RsbU (regulator of sigma subunit)